MWRPDPIRSEALDGDQLAALYLVARGRLRVGNPADPVTEPVQAIARKGLVHAPGCWRWQLTEYGRRFVAALAACMARVAA